MFQSRNKLTHLKIIFCNKSHVLSLGSWVLTSISQLVLAPVLLCFFPLFSSPKSQCAQGITLSNGSLPHNSHFTNPITEHHSYLPVSFFLVLWSLQTLYPIRTLASSIPPLPHHPSSSVLSSSLPWNSSSIPQYFCPFSLNHRSWSDHGCL